MEHQILHVQHCGLYIAVRYTIRICDMEDTGEKLEYTADAGGAKTEEEELRQQAAADPLTGLYNRQYADEKIESMLKQKNPFTVCFGFDGLKYVNDQFGHEEGDHYIPDDYGSISRAAAAAERSALQIWRDEFLILFEGLLAKSGGEGRSDQS